MSKDAIFFGGTFNPLTKAHDEILNLSKKELALNKVIIVPTSDRFLYERKEFSKKDLIDSDIRLEILKKYCKSNDFILELCETEGKTYKTLDTIRFIKKEYGLDNIYFICGSEKLEELETWYKPNELVKEVHFVVFTRNNENVSNKINKIKFVKDNLDRFIFLEANKDFQEFSSTKVREAINRKDEETIEKMTFDFVIKILKKRGVL